MKKAYTEVTGHSFGRVESSSQLAEGGKFSRKLRTLARYQWR
jgi:hypothetical protein